jgi:predicted  nucleic acid-binding Zn-ribbon protein
MTPHICVTCGTRFATSQTPLHSCPIGAAERQYLGHQDPCWTTPDDLRRDHRNNVHQIARGVTGFTTEPSFAIGQQAHLIETPVDNLLWDCISLIDDETVAEVERRGGLDAIAISHPHFYSSMVEWSHAFGGVPIYLHGDDREWVNDPDPAITFWTGETYQPLPGSGLTLIRCGGHFPGSSIAHWAAGADGNGALFTGDTITVARDHQWVSFMYSYPNLIPLPAAAVRRIVIAIDPFDFDRLYGGWQDSTVQHDAKGAVRRSAERYIAHLHAPVLPPGQTMLAERGKEALKI